MRRRGPRNVPCTDGEALRSLLRKPLNHSQQPLLIWIELDATWADCWEAKTDRSCNATYRNKDLLAGFDREQSSQESPVALVVPATSIMYTFPLRTLEVAIEKVSILITAYSGVCQSLEGKHLRQRQRVLQALREVERTSCDAIIAARTEWEQGTNAACPARFCSRRDSGGAAMIEDSVQEEDWVTEDPAALEAFVATGREHYAALEQALEPLATTVTDLKRDWKPRWKGYWKLKLTALLSLRTATQATFEMFDREQSSEEAPVPVIFYGANMGYTIPLSLVEGRIEEAGILLASYVEVCDVASGTASAPTSACACGVARGGRVYARCHRKKAEPDWNWHRRSSNNFLHLAEHVRQSTRPLRHQPRTLLSSRSRSDTPMLSRPSNRLRLL